MVNISLIVAVCRLKFTLWQMILHLALARILMESKMHHATSSNVKVMRVFTGVPEKSNLKVETGFTVENL